MTELSRGPTSLQPPDEITRSLFGQGRRVAHAHPLTIDALVAAVLLAVCTVWLAQSGFGGLRTVLVQAALIGLIAARRVWPAAVFLAACAIGFAQWLLGFPLLGDVALLVALYTVAAHQSRARALLAAVVLEAGAVMAAAKWEPAGTLPRSLLFLTATVVAALFAGMTAASGSRYLAWMDERARRLEIERDQQATIAAAAERTRIARELHDIVSHSLSVVITLADAAALVSRADPGPGRRRDGRSLRGRPARALGHAGHARRAAHRRTAGQPGPAAPAARRRAAQRAGGADPGHRAGRQPVRRGHPVPARRRRRADRVPHRPGGADQHPPPRGGRARVGHDQLRRARGADPGGRRRHPGDPGRASSGHGIEGMRERAALHHGALHAGPADDGGWLVEATLRPGTAVPV